MFCSLNLLKHTIMLNLIAVFLVCSGIGIAVHIAIDLTHRPQSMKIMNAVWILSALWGSYLALWAYNKFGRSSPMKAEDDGMKMDMSGMKDMSDMKGMDTRNATSLLAIGSFVGASLWCRMYIGRYHRRVVYELCSCNCCRQSTCRELGT